MHRLLVLLFILFLISCSSEKRNVENTKNSSSFKKIYPLALRGEMLNVFKILDTINTNDLSTDEKAMREQYYNRFILNKDNYDYKTEDTSIIGFVQLFQSYWKSVMMNNLSSKVGDSIFIDSMANYLTPYFKDKEFTVNDIKENMYRASNEFLKNLGYYSNAAGKTGHLFDLFLWKEEEIKVFPIKLVDDSVNVSVHFMKDFIVTGWSHYSTFGRNFASGWANKEALYCVENAYDRSTENFRVSYLTHEGQHFSDYKKFPKLKQTDLEYRAKLVELIKSETTTFNIIQKFIFNATKQKNNAHGFANYCVIRDLSKELFKEEYVTDKDKWISSDVQKLKERSIYLFRKHTSKLYELGSETVTKLIDFN